MKDNLTEWNQRAWLVLEQLPGSLAAPLRVQWNERAHRDKSVVTLFGAYDTGKTSLLKRLLLDESTQGPDWLTISARRETFEINDAEVCGVIVRDTPGIAGGNTVHEAATDAALLRTDAVVVVLPPQLVTGDAGAVEAITGVLDGSRFHSGPEQCFPPSAMMVVMARMDEAGAMPDIDLEGYETLVMRKRDELGDFLSRIQVPENLLSIHAVVADWAGMAGGRVNASAADYDGSRSWDGMAAFATDLRLLSARREELRTWSERRFLRTHLGQTRQGLELHLRDTKLALESATNEAEAFLLQVSRLNALTGNARADLDRRVAEEVQAVCQRGDVNPETVERLLGERLQGSLDRWWEAQDALLQSLAEEFDTEIQHRHARPDWQAMADMLGGIGPRADPGAEEAENDPAARQRAEILEIAQMLIKAYSESAPLILDMPLDKAREELQRLRQASSFQEYAKQTTLRKGGFRDVSHADRAETMLKIGAVITAAAPVVIEIAGIVTEHQAEARAAERRIARRAELQANLENASETIIEQVWIQWHDEEMAAALSEALEEAVAGASGRIELFKHQHDNCMEALSRVQSIMEWDGDTAKGTGD